MFLFVDDLGRLHCGRLLGSTSIITPDGTEDVRFTSIKANHAFTVLLSTDGRAFLL